MQTEEITEKDRAKAKQCLECSLCNRAREKQKGLIFWFVKKLESGICPACKAYEKVYHRKAHEPMPKSSGTNNAGQWPATLWPSRLLLEMDIHY